jgi:hypothetical protein
MIGDLVDPLRQEGDLNLGRTGVRFVHPELADQFLLLLRLQPHFDSPFPFKGSDNPADFPIYHL